jgi:hypothetical protein
MTKYYDSAAMVQVLPYWDPAIKLMDVKVSSIYPKLSVKEIHVAFEKKVHTPMQYGKCDYCYDFHQGVREIEGLSLLCNLDKR